MLILVADDDRKLNQIICSSLREAKLSPDPVFSAAEARNKLQHNDYALAILDWMFDDEELTGCDLIQVVARSGRNTPVLLLTGRSALADRVKGLQQGADDYLVKPFYLPELIARTNALLRRKSANAQATKRLIKGEIMLDSDYYEVQLAGQPVALSNKEFQLLKFLLEKNGAIATRTELTNEIWGENAGVATSNTIDVHIRRLRKNFGKLSSAIQTVRGIGYRLIDPKK